MNTDAPFARVILRVAAVILAAGGASSAVHAQAPAPPPAATPAPAPQRNVSRVDVIGNQRIETSTILSYVSVREGDAYDAAAVDAAQKTLFGTGLFSNVSTSFTARSASATV